MIMSNVMTENRSSLIHFARFPSETTIITIYALSFSSYLKPSHKNSMSSANYFKPSDVSLGIDADSALTIATRLSRSSFIFAFNTFRRCNLAKREEQVRRRCRNLAPTSPAGTIIDYPFSMSYVPFHVHIDSGYVVSRDRRYVREVSRGYPRQQSSTYAHTRHKI